MAPSRSFRRYIPVDPENPEQLRDVAVTERCDLILAASDTALSVISDHYESLAAVATVGCPPANIAKRVLDTTITLETAARFGIRIPVTYNNVDASSPVFTSIPGNSKAWRKGSELPADFKVRYYRNEAELAAAFAADAAFARKYLIQSYCDGYGVGIAMLIHNGNAVGIFQHRRIRSFRSAAG